jgi:hypothetical protein
MKRNYSGLPRNLNIVSEFDKITKINLINPLKKNIRIANSFDSDLRINLDNLKGIDLEIDKEVNCTLIKDLNGG